MILLVKQQLELHLVDKKIATAMSCNLFDETLNDLIDIAYDTSKQKSIAVYANSMTTAAVGTCSDDELSNLETDKESLEAIVTDNESELNKHQKCCHSSHQTQEEIQKRPVPQPTLFPVLKSVVIHPIRLNKKFRNNQFLSQLCFQY